MPTRTPTGDLLPSERVRGYATLAPEYAQMAVNVAANFCQSVVEGLIPHGSLATELQARMTREEIRLQLKAAFDGIRSGAWPCDYDFERVVLVLCDDSVRDANLEQYEWPDYVRATKRRVILEFVWHFPPPIAEPMVCTFWVSADSPGLSVCKFAHARIP